MKETLELRLNLDFAHLLFKDDEGKKIDNLIKIVELAKDDPRFEIIPSIVKDIQEMYNKAFFFGWKIKRIYSNNEFNSAALIHLKVVSTFEPAGEECGTLYDEEKSCPICGFGRIQKGFLQLKKGSVPSKDIARTISGELVVSRKFVDAFYKYGLSGCCFNPVKFKNEDFGYFQIIPTSPTLDLSLKTVVGINPFDFSENCDNEIYKCPHGHSVGLNLISEPHVLKSEHVNGFDFFVTKQCIGVKRGLLRPEPLTLCSLLFKKMIDNEKLKGFEFEICHID